ncbi:hypothetical protein GCM10023334_037620 [Nonomuraea thailandensis]
MAVSSAVVTKGIVRLLSSRASRLLADRSSPGPGRPVWPVRATLFTVRASLIKRIDGDDPP